MSSYPGAGYMGGPPNTMNNYPLNMPPTSSTGSVHLRSEGPPPYYFQQQPTYENTYYPEGPTGSSGFQGPKFYEPKGFPAEGSSVGLVQRLSMLIKSQLPYLQRLSIGMQSGRREEQFYKRPHRSRSRSRDRQSRRKRSSRSKSPSSMDWLCPKCSFSNYEWRDRCKRCNESRTTKNFMPGPEDWRCPECGNINYARRLQCNRCKSPRKQK